MAKEKNNEQTMFGQASSHRSEHGKLVVVHEDTEHEGELYKAGNHDLTVEVADGLIEREKATELEGKGKGRDEEVGNG